MVKVAFIENDDAGFGAFVSFVGRYQELKGEKIAVSRFYDGSEIASDYKPIYDIIFLRVESELTDGCAAAKKIREYDRTVTIVFIADTAAFAVEGYDLEVAGYLLTPITYETFARLMDRLLTRPPRRPDKYITFKQENCVVKLSCSRILYVESEAHLITVHTEKKAYRLFSTLKEMESLIGLRYFVRCNSSYLVNLEYVDLVKNNTVYLGDKVALKISKHKKRIFLEKLAIFAHGADKSGLRSVPERAAKTTRSGIEK